MEGFNNDDIRTPSPGVNINVNELLVLPGEIVDDYMIRWGNRHKQTSIQEMQVDDGSKISLENDNGSSTEAVAKPSYAAIVQENDQKGKRKVNFRTLETNVSDV